MKIALRISSATIQANAVSLARAVEPTEHELTAYDDLLLAHLHHGAAHIETAVRADHVRGRRRTAFWAKR